MRDIFQYAENRREAREYPSIKALHWKEVQIDLWHVLIEAKTELQESLEEQNMYPTWYTEEWLKASNPKGLRASGFSDV